jgi:hypothetical protein
MEMSTKVVAVLVLAVLAAASTEARNIKTTEAASKDAVLQPTTFPPFDRFGSASPAFGGMPGFSLPGSSGATPGLGGIGSMPFLGGSSPGLGGSPALGGFGRMPGSPAAASVDEHAQKP